MRCSHHCRLSHEPEQVDDKNARCRGITQVEIITVFLWARENRKWLVRIGILILKITNHYCLHNSWKFLLNSICYL